MFGLSKVDNGFSDVTASQLVFEIWSPLATWFLKYYTAYKVIHMMLLGKAVVSESVVYSVCSVLLVDLKYNNNNNNYDNLYGAVTRPYRYKGA